jgi:hypothetical protein
MNVAELYRTTIDELTRERPGGPELSAVIAGGRRRRRVRRTAWAGGALAVVAATAPAGMVLTHGGDQVAVDTGPGPATSATVYHDFVRGSDVDEMLQATVAQHLPSMPAAESVYPSDWNTSGPIPDAQAADATEWHATYQVSGSEKLTLVMSLAIPGQPTSLSCDDVTQADIPCRRVDLPDGSQETTAGYVLGSSTYRFMTVHVARDGRVVETLDDVTGSSVAQARAARGVTDDALSSLVRDPALTFAAPIHPPAPPVPQA